MLQQYLKRGALNIICYGASSIIARLLSFFCLPYFLSKLTPAEFGVWEMHQTVLSVGTLLVASCASTAMTRFCVLYQHDKMKQKQAVGNAFIAVLVTALFFFMISYLVLDHVHITVLNICLFALFAVLIAYLRVREYLLLYFIFFCGQNSIAAICMIVGLYNGFGLDAFFYAQCASYILFLPFFIILLFRYKQFSWVIFKEQVMYSIPLVINALLYMLFFTVDRFFVQHTMGYEALGLYGLLWRFGTIFQFFAVAVTDARIILLCHAQKEQESDILVQKLITYFCLLLATGVVGSLVLSCCAIRCFFPASYQGLVLYLPLFFIALAFLEIGRVMGSGFILAMHTRYAPLLVMSALLTQLIACYSAAHYGLWGIISANTFAFLIFGLAHYWYSKKVYSLVIFDHTRLTKIFVCLISYSSVYHLLFLYNISAPVLVLFACSWPICVWLSGVIADDEKEWCSAQITRKMNSYLN